MDFHLDVNDPILRKLDEEKIETQSIQKASQTNNTNANYKTSNNNTTKQNRQHSNKSIPYMNST